MSLFSSVGASYTVTPQTGFSSELMNTLIASRSKVEQWVQHEKAKADKSAEEYRQELEQEQKEIDTKTTNLLAVQLERGLSVVTEKSAEQSMENSENLANKKTALEEQRTLLQSEIDHLKLDYRTREARVKEITAEEEKQRQRAENARSLKQRIEEHKATTVDDLTRGIVNFKYTGLDFIKTDVENGLDFTFTQLDPVDPARKFSFLLQINADEKYEIANCRPEVDATVLIDIANVLNKDDDMSYLVRKMRQAFSETL